MMCMSPMRIKNAKGDFIDVPCGKCAACLTNRREEWTTRLLIEAKNHLDAIFLTLTYNDDNIPYGSLYPTLIKSDFQSFLKRFRKRLGKRKIRYYAVGEYGKKDKRPHYHAIMFNVSAKDAGLIQESWNNGFIYVGDVNIASIKYVCKYHLMKNDKVEGSQDSFVLMSRKPGIGNSYISEFREFHKRSIKNCYVQDNENRRKLPRYYKEALYNKFDRKKIAEINESRNDNYKKLLAYKKKFPNGNYFKDEMCRKENFTRKFKLKASKNEKI